MRRRELKLAKCFLIQLYILLPILLLIIPLYLNFGSLDILQPYLNTKIWRKYLVGVNVSCIVMMSFIFGRLYLLMDKGHKYELIRIKKNMLFFFFNCIAYLTATIIFDSCCIRSWGFNMVSDMDITIETLF